LPCDFIIHLSKNIELKFLILILLPIFSFGQTFLGIGITTHGVTAGGGYMFKDSSKLKNYQIEFDYRCPLKRTDVPNTSSLLFGRNLRFSVNTDKKEVKGFNLNYAIGVGYYRVQEFYKYNYINNFSIEQKTKIKASYKLELSKRISDGILYISANHCGIDWYSFGFKTIISNIKKHR